MADRDDLQRLRRLKELETRAGHVPHDFNAANMVKNIPGSAVQFAKDVVHPILHPIDTMISLQDVASGAAQRLAAGDDKSAYSNPEAVETFDAAWDMMKERYGGWDEIKRSAENDPVGILSDAVGVLFGGSTVAGKMGGKIAKVASAVDPANLVTNTATAAVKAATPDSLPGRLYEKSAKFRPSLDPDQRQRMVDTALDEDIMPTNAGLQKLEDVLSAEGAKLDEMIASAESAGKTVPKGKILSKAREVRNRLDKTTQPGYEKVTRQIDNVLNETGRQWKDVDALTPTQAQEFKRKLDEAINWNRRQLASKQGTESAQRALRSGAKEALEGLDPNVAPTNRRMGDLLELREKGLEQAANRIENRDVLGLSQIGAAGVGTAAAGPAGTAAGAAVGLLQGPRTQAKLALLLRKLHQSPLKDVYFKNGQIGPVLRQFLVQSGRVAQVSQDTQSQTQQQP